METKKERIKTKEHKQKYLSKQTNKRESSGHTQTN